MPDAPTRKEAVPPGRPAAAREASRPCRRWVAPTVAVAVLLAAWQAVVSLGVVPSFLLPGPGVASRNLI